MEKDKKYGGKIDMKRMKKNKFEAGISTKAVNIWLVLVLSSIVLISGIATSGNISFSANKSKSIAIDNPPLVPHPIFGKAEYETGGWTVGANVEVVSSEGTLTDTVGDSGEWQVDCGDPGPSWPEGTDFTVWINGTGSYSGWSGKVSGTVSGYYNDMGNVILYPQPDLDCDGSLSWTDVSPGETVTGSFTVENIGISGSKLDWEVKTWPSWGTWTFNPSDGDDLKPEDGTVTVEVTVVAPDEQNAEFEGEVKVVNKEDSSDFCIIPVSLSTPVNQNSMNSQVLEFLQKVVQWFSMLE